MKYLILFNIAFCISYFVPAHYSFSQTKSRIITNTPNLLLISLEFSSKDIRDIGDGFSDESNPGAPILPSKIFYIAIPPNSKASARLDNKVLNTYEAMIPKANPRIRMLNDTTLTYSDTEISDEFLITDSYPQSDVEVTGYTWIRDYYCAVIKVNTHIYEWKKKKVTEIISADMTVNIRGVKSFQRNSNSIGVFDEGLRKIILNYDEAQNLRSYPEYDKVTSDHDEWIDYNNEYVKLSVAVDGIYRITYDDLFSYGITPSSIDPKKIKIIYKGNEIPILVNGEEDLSFDSQDYIEFWSTKNYGSQDYRAIVERGSDYNNFMDRYIDTTFVWLSWSGEDGLRTVSYNGLLINNLDTLTSHKVILHLEEDIRLWYSDVENARTQLPMWQEHKVFTWKFIDASRTRSVPFSVKNVFPNTNCKVITRLISNAADVQNNAHSNCLSINNVVGDTIIFDYLETVNLNSSFSSSLLKNGQNTLKIHGLTTAATFHRSMIDWVDIEYERYNKAERDSIYLLIPDGVVKSVKAIKIDNLSSTNIILYKIKPELKRITNFSLITGSSNSIVFSDEVEEGDAYFLVDEGKIHKPKYVKKRIFENLSSSDHTGEYIIISNRALLPSVNNYKEFISDNYNLSVQLIFVDDIYDQFSYGYFNPEAIKDFLIEAYQNWSYPKPTYLLLIGDANYDYKNKWNPAPSIRKQNLVPSFGYPVSDSWYVIWGEDESAIPQMYVGRIPAMSYEDVEYYLEKHTNYLDQPNDIWNKTYLLFSGGNPAKPSIMSQIKSTNGGIQNNMITPAPIGGIGRHFYKTSSPQTNYGPYTTAEFLHAIGEGAIIISYIGHSGTQTWDNGITSVEQLKNNYENKLPLISDFGCSTGKFAEPDIDAFGEIFLRDKDGQAIGYLGNASLGYLSTSLSFPDIFYQLLLLGDTQILGATHLNAKVKQYQDYGINNVNRLFTYSNILFGDPIINIKIPSKPNYLLRLSDMDLITDQPNETMDSVMIKIPYLNYGVVPEDSIALRITASNNKNIFYDIALRIPSPLYSDSVFVKIPTENLAGEHLLEISIDSGNEIDESNEDDNTIVFSYNVYSASLRFMSQETFYNNYNNELRILNPTRIIGNQFQRIRLQISDEPNFYNPVQSFFPVDTFCSLITFDNIKEGQRYWCRIRPDNEFSPWSQTISFKNNPDQYNWFADEPDTLNNSISYENTIFDSATKRWELIDTDRELNISSAGQSAGSFVSIQYEGKEQLPKTYFWGMVSMLVDSLTYEPYDLKYFEFPSSVSAPSLIEYINSLPNGTLIALAICDDGAQSVLGYSSGTEVRKAIESCGSYYIDSVRYRESWCMLGRKGAPKGSVPEVYKKLFEGHASINQSINVRADKGMVVFPIVGSAVSWDSVKINSDLPEGSRINLFATETKSDGTVDTLGTIPLVNNVGALKNIVPSFNNKFQIVTELYSNDLQQSPALLSLGVKYSLSPELGTNYQVASVNKDTLELGEDIDLSFYVYNVGETSADSFNVAVDVVNPDDTRTNIYNKLVNSIGIEQREVCNLTYNAARGSGNFSFFITIDSDDKILELYEDNNFYSIPFYVKPDTTRPVMNIVFDGIDIMDGDYVAPEPLIAIDVSDESLLPITDTAAVEIFLNNNPVYFAQNMHTLTYSFSDSNPKFMIEYKPELEKGEYELKVIARDESGNLAQPDGITKRFIVEEDAKILYPYNYPNPFSDETYFTFKLTQIPDELKIKIYTVAGRLIKEIKKSSADLTVDFNRIYWDGRDQDGDMAANGVYIYKIIMTIDDRTENITQKLAIVR